MITWICENIGTLIVSILLLVILSFNVINIRKAKKKGKSICCGDCSHCGAHCPSHFK